MRKRSSYYAESGNEAIGYLNAFIENNRINVKDINITLNWEFDDDD